MRCALALLALAMICSTAWPESKRKDPECEAVLVPMFESGIVTVEGELTQMREFLELSNVHHESISAEFKRNFLQLASRTKAKILLGRTDPDHVAEYNRTIVEAVFTKFVASRMYVIFKESSYLLAPEDLDDLLITETFSDYPSLAQIVSDGKVKRLDEIIAKLESPFQFHAFVSTLLSKHRQPKYFEAALAVSNPVQLKVFRLGTIYVHDHRFFTEIVPNVEIRDHAVAIASAVLKDGVTDIDTLAALLSSSSL